MGRRSIRQDDSWEVEEAQENLMDALDNPTLVVARNLRQAIDQLRRDIRKVEMWADALNGFSQPIPDYDGADTHLLTPRGDEIPPPHKNR